MTGVQTCALPISYEKDFFTAVDLIAEPEVGRLTFEMDRELARKGFLIYEKMKASDLKKRVNKGYKCIH